MDYDVEFRPAYALLTVDLDASETYIVDTGHVVAFEATTDFFIRRVGGLRSTLFYGEGLICTFIGPGKLYLQIKSEDALLSWLVPKLPTTANHSTRLQRACARLDRPIATTALGRGRGSSVRERPTEDVL